MDWTVEWERDKSAGESTLCAQVCVAPQECQLELRPSRYRSQVADATHIRDKVPGFVATLGRRCPLRKSKHCAYRMYISFLSESRARTPSKKEGPDRVFKAPTCDKRPDEFEWSYHSNFASYHRSVHAPPWSKVETSLVNLQSRFEIRSDLLRSRPRGRKRANLESQSLTWRVPMVICGSPRTSAPVRARSASGRRVGRLQRSKEPRERPPLKRRSPGGRLATQMYASLVLFFFVGNAPYAGRAPNHVLSCPRRGALGCA